MSRRQHERALDRLREVAKSRGQKVREFPSESKEPTTRAQPEPVTPAVTKTPWERGPLPSWARRWTSQDTPRATGQNMAQRIVLILSFLVILGMALFPPWLYVFNPSAELRDSYVRVERPAGYHFMFGHHSPKDETQLLAIFNFRPTGGWEREAISLHLFSIRLDTNRLAVQIAVATLLTAILYFALRGKPNPPTH